MQFLYTIAAGIDSFNSPILAAGLLATGAGFIFLRSKRHAAALVLSCVCAAGMGIALKLLFAIPRPDAALVPVSGYRFPSQHALLAGAFFSSVCLSAFCLFRSRWAKLCAFIFSLCAVGIVAWSRVFLHTHLPIDVTVGALLGIGISMVIQFLILRKKCRH